MRKITIKQSIIFYLLSFGIIFHVVDIQSMNVDIQSITQSKNKKNLAHLKESIKWNKNIHLFAKSSSKKRVNLVSKLLKKIEPKSQKERPLFTLWNKLSNENKQKGALNAFYILFLLHSGKYYDVETCTQYFVRATARLKLQLKNDETITIIERLFSTLWEKIDSVHREAWCSSSLHLLEKFWQKFSPKEQMAVLEKTITQKLVFSPGIEKILSLLTPEQSKELAHHCLTNDTRYSYLCPSLTKEQLFFYCKEQLERKEKKLKLNIPFDVSNFVDNITKLGRFDRMKIIDSMLTSKLSSEKKIGIILNSKIWDALTKEEKNTYGITCNNILKQTSGAKLLGVLEKYQHTPVVQKNIKTRILKKDHTGAKIIILQKEEKNKSSWYRYFNRAFDHSSSAEKCLLLEIFRKNFYEENSKKKRACWPYYLDRISTECNQNDIQRYQELFKLNKIS